MHEVEVEVVGAEVLPRGIERRLDIVGVERIVPELGGDEEFFAGDAGILDCVADGSFGAVDARCVDVAVVCLESNRYSPA